MNIITEYQKTQHNHRPQTARRPLNQSMGRLSRPPQLSLRELRAEILQMVG